MRKQVCLLWMALLLVPAGARANEAPSEGGAVVRIVDFMRFEPPSLTVAPGTTVTWINQDGSNHVIELQGGVKGPRLRHGASYGHRFDAPGDYPYHCGIHGERMSGTINVRAP